MKVTVTQKNIEDATRDYYAHGHDKSCDHSFSRCCPIAKAFNDLGYEQVSVNRFTANINDGGIAHLPRAAINFIDTFDAWIERGGSSMIFVPKPFEFEAT